MEGTWSHKLTKFEILLYILDSTLLTIPYISNGVA